MGKFNNNRFICPNAMWAKPYVYEAAFIKHVSACSKLSTFTPLKESKPSKLLTKPKPFACSNCLKGFAGLKTLSNHIAFNRCSGSNKSSSYCDINDRLYFSNVFGPDIASLYADEIEIY